MTDIGWKHYHWASRSWAPWTLW